MQSAYREKVRELTVAITDEVDDTMVSELRALIARLDIASIRIDVSAVCRMNIAGLRLLSDLKEFADQAGTDFKIVGRKRRAVRKAFEGALELTSVYSNNPQPNAYLGRFA